MALRSADIVVRRYRPDDLKRAIILDRRVAPYSPAEQAAVEAMFERARDAERRRDPRWMPQPPAPAPQSPVDEVGCWVAESFPDREIVGIVALHRAGYGAEAPPDVALFDNWRSRDDVVELRRLRVAPEHRRQGVATALNRTAIAWSRDNRKRVIALNTTAAQLPALSLYQGLGFREVFRSFVGRYELVWMVLFL